METALQMQTFFDDSNQDVNCDGDPNLGSARIFRCAIEGLDSQMLLDPSKKEFYLPTTSIELSNRESGQEKVVCEKHQTFLACHIEVTHSAKPLGIATPGDRIVEHDDLIALQAGLFVHLLGVKPPTVETFLGPRHKECSRLMHAVESSKIYISTVHQVNGPGFPDQLIEDVDLVNLSARGDSSVDTNLPSSFTHCSIFAAAFPRVEVWVWIIPKFKSINCLLVIK